MAPALVALGAVTLVALTVVAVAVGGRVHYARRLPFFRCRVGPPAALRRRRRGQRWEGRRTYAVWVDGVLLLRSGLLRLWITPLAVDLPLDAAPEVLLPRQARGLGDRPTALRFTADHGREMELAVAHGDADRLFGPFLVAGLAGLPEAPRERGGSP